MIATPPGRPAAVLGGALFLLVATAAVPSAAGTVYTSPRDGAAYVLRTSSVIVRSASPVIESDLARAGALQVTGSASGPLAGRLRLAGDRRTILFEPDRPFAPGERVTCRVGANVASGADGTSGAFAFAFTVAGPQRDALREWRAPPESEEAPDLAGTARAAVPAAAAASPAAATEPLPADYPVATVTTTGRTAPGTIFLSNLLRTGPGTPGYLLEIGNDGAPAFLRKLAGGSVDFKQQPDGRLTYFDEAAGCFYALDASYAVVDSFRTGNGYVTDHHDLQLLPNGHALLMAYDPQIVDMTVIDPKMRPDATVIGLVVQELDEAKNVVFQWRSWDHFQITDAVGVLLGASVVDYVHGNSVEAAPDGNLVLSSRHLNEITKIDRETGGILWRLGGKHNEFEFVGDPVRFSRQHDARILPNGNITLFDNGNLDVPRVSRALEYRLDERKMTATLVWQFRHPLDVFSPAMGSVQRLGNGNTAIGWGFAGPAYTEVTPDGRIVEEVFLEPGVLSYRAFRFERPAPLPAVVEIAPRTLNLGSGGTTTALVESDAFSVEDIDPATVRLDDAIPAEPDAATPSGANADGAPDLTFRFDRAALAARLDPGEHLVGVSGALRDGTRFRGYALVNVVEASPRKAAASFVRVLSPPGALPVVLGIERTARTAGPESRVWTIRIFDARGRLAATRRATADGSGRLVWDGRRADGRRVAAGVYFARVGDATAGVARRIVIVR